MFKRGKGINSIVAHVWLPSRIITSVNRLISSEPHVGIQMSFSNALRYLIRLSTKDLLPPELRIPNHPRGKEAGKKIVFTMDKVLWDSIIFRFEEYSNRFPSDKLVEASIVRFLITNGLSIWERQSGIIITTVPEATSTASLLIRTKRRGPKESPKTLKAVELMKEGLSAREAADRTESSITTLYRYLNRHKNEVNYIPYLRKPTQTKTAIELIRKGMTPVEAISKTGVTMNALRCYVQKHPEYKALIPTKIPRLSLAVAAVQSGDSVETTANQLGLSKKSIRNHIRSNHQEITLPIEKRSSKAPQAVELMRSGSSLEEAAAKVGLKLCSIYLYLSKHPEEKATIPNWGRNAETIKAIERMRDGIPIQEAASSAGTTVQAIRSYLSRHPEERIGLPERNIKCHKAIVLMEEGVAFEQAATQSSVGKDTLRQALRTLRRNNPKRWGRIQEMHQKEPSKTMQAIALMQCGATATEAAKEVGISKETVYKYVHLHPQIRYLLGKDASKVETAVRLVRQGYSVTEAAEKVGINTSGIYRHLKENQGIPANSTAGEPEIVIEQNHVSSNSNQLVGQRLRRARLMRDLTQETLGSLAGGIDRVQMCDYENGRRKLFSKRLESIARVLDILPLWLATGQGPMTLDGIHLQVSPSRDKRRGAQGGITESKEHAE